MNEFTSRNTLQALLLLVAQSRSRIECGTSTVALEDVLQCGPWRGLDMKRSAAKALNQHTAICVHCGMANAHAALERPRANIRCGAGKNCSGRRTMDLFVVVIIAAMLFTVATVLLGVFTMSVGGSTNKTLSTPLMWARVGFQALTILLLFAAIRLR
jgi:hypothetical protein